MLSSVVEHLYDEIDGLMMSLMGLLSCIMTL